MRLGDDTKNQFSFSFPLCANSRLKREPISQSIAAAKKNNNPLRLSKCQVIFIRFLCCCCKSTEMNEIIEYSMRVAIGDKLKCEDGSEVANKWVAKKKKKSRSPAGVS